MTKEEVTRVLDRFRRGVLTREEWNHQSHIIAGLHHVLTNDNAAAAAALKDEIERLGAFNKLRLVYNVTVTEAWVRLLRGYVEANPGLDLVGLVNSLPTPMQTRMFLHRFYSEDQLYARGHGQFVEPDRAPLDWRTG
jgi:hypothetical protein